jgi:uncharacterized protein YecE (DUF72 family)
VQPDILPISPLDFHLFFTYSGSMILIGTNGFQHRDWTPVFYPKGLDPRCWLRHYSRHFGCCELGFTCYRLPEPAAIQELMEESGGALQFLFRVPFKMVEGSTDNSEMARQFAAALWPLKEAGQLCAVVAQFGPGFEFMRDNFQRLCRLRDALEGMTMVAEFGNQAWLTPKAAKHLAAEHIPLACVDGGKGLSQPTFYCSTAGLAYVRFQGRNSSRWIKGDGSTQHDYLYSRAELEAAVPDIRRLGEQVEQVVVLMNNTWRGQAALNARMLLELLG